MIVPNRIQMPSVVILLCAAGLLSPADCLAGPLSDLLWGGRNDYYYPIGREYVRANASPANPVTAYYAPAPAPLTSAPVATAPVPSTSYYAPPAAATVPGSPSNATTVLSPPVMAAPSATGPVTTYRLTSPVVTSPVATSPVGGVAPAGALLPATPASAAPTTTYYAPATAAAMPYAAPAATTTYYANAAQVAGCNTCAVPAASYRTVWYRIPVTNYRPVTAMDPCTGCPTTVMRPCTTYSWQARRVPDERPRSWLSRLFCCFHRRPPPPPATVIPPVTVTNCAPTVNYGCGATAAPVGGTISTPYYTTPATAPATSPAPVGTAPGYTTPPGYSAPGYSTPATPGNYPGGGVPADYPPSLNPGSAPAPLRDGSAYPPSSGSYLPSNGNGSSAGDSNGNNGSNGSNGGNGNGTSGNGGNGQDSGDQGTGATGSATSTSSGGMSGPILGGPGAPRLNPQPVPDPDAMRAAPQHFDPPRLLNPRDRSAAAPRAGAFVLISWPELRTASAEQPLEEAPQPQPAARPQVDDGGWRSIAR